MRCSPAALEQTMQPTFPQVQPYTGHRLKWPGALLAAFSLITNTQAQGDDWREFAALTDGSTWSYRASSVGRISDWTVAEVQRTTSDSQKRYRAHVKTSHCQEKFGDVMLSDIDTGAAVSTAVFQAGSTSLPAAIAATLCAAANRGTK
jgi:predicted phage tail protein